MLTRMRKWLDENRAKKDDPTSGYMGLEVRYLYSAGLVAESSGDKVDAIAFYVRAMASGWLDREKRKRVRALWDQQGGTAAGWDLVTQRLPAPEPGKAIARPRTATASDFAAWKKAGLALPAMNLPDISGRTWTLADFNGKTTFVNLWATWCGGCRDELPHLQKLYELAQGHPEIQVITFNLDENPGLVQPFLAANHYTFPVVPARLYVSDFLGQYAIPQNWLVDAKAILREKSVGFDAPAPDSPKQMLERLTHIPE